ncbi:MAG: hypothetical protein OZSIB_2196 [Candidatus Ozemobacter sibiricus]|jgi:hypothetical protein|uniref:Uncharacterized protein n=1 Tax=Candidatus Ozemobacter sibiricus TaxID=2268124 RepID=A0A367ZTZ8_9BACT|nr:MAG: hypothetical protein OZSIB_2196 [Candidatus Ozemobacter sibiricus]
MNGRFPRLRSRSLIALIVIVCLAGGLAPAQAIKLPELKLGRQNTLGKVLTGAGIILLIKQFGGALNDFINTLLLNKGAANREATKVVPILTLGQGIEAGACQVSGPPDAVAKVQVVLAIAATFDKGKRFNIQALIPSASLNPAKLDRVYGVGITAIIDYRL